MLYHILYNFAFYLLTVYFFNCIFNERRGQSLNTKKYCNPIQESVKCPLVDKFNLKYSRLTIQQKSFSRLGARLWTSIPLTIRNLRKSSFKKNKTASSSKHLTHSPKTSADMCKRMPGSLNKKSELISTCRHVNKHLIKNA